MKIFHFYRTLVLALLFLPIQILPAQSSTAQKTQSILIDNEFNKLLNNSLQQLNRFEYLLEKLALLVHADSGKIDNAKEIKEYILKTKNLIDQIKQSSFLVPSLGKIAIVQKINCALSKNLNDANNSQKWNAIDLQSIIKRSQEKPDLGKIEFEQALNQKNLIELESIIEKFGLTKTQLRIRKIEDFCKLAKDKIDKYNVMYYLKWSAAIAAGAAYLTYQYGDKYKGFTFLNKAKDLIGSPPQYTATPARLNPETGDIIPKNLFGTLKANTGTGWFGWAEQPFNKKGFDFTPSTLVLGSSLGYVCHNAVDDWKSMMISFGFNKASNNPIFQAATLTNAFLQIKNSKKFNLFKSDVKYYLKDEYAKLRGTDSTGQLKTIVPKASFNDVIGEDYAKSQLETVVDFIVNPEKFERTKLTPAKGYLMVGPPRTGKSFMAEAVCGEIKKRQKLLGKPEITNFIQLDADLISNDSFYSTMQHIYNMAPCIVFIDEIDMLGLHRGTGNDQNKLLSQLLSHMSGYINPKEAAKTKKHVIFIGATNNPHKLDDALLQSGRFGKKISFEYPPLADRVAFINKQLDKFCISSVTPEFVDQFAKELEGHTFDEIDQVIKSALQKASKEYASLSEDFLTTAIEENIKSIMPTYKKASPKEEAIFAAYQAGKAVALSLLRPDINISTVTIMPINEKIKSKKESHVISKPTVVYGDVFTYKNTDLLNLRDSETIRLMCQIELAGHAAQEIILGNSVYSYRSDSQQKALEMAKEIYLKGIEYNDLPDAVKQEVLQDAYKIKTESNDLVSLLLKQNEAKLKEIFNELKESKTLDRIKINELLAGPVAAAA